MVQFLLNIGFEWLYPPEPGYVTEYIFINGTFNASAMNDAEPGEDWLIYIDDPIAGATDIEILTRDPAAIIQFIQKNWKP